MENRVRHCWNFQIHKQRQELLQTEANYLERDWFCNEEAMPLVAGGMSCYQQMLAGTRMACTDNSEALLDNQSCLQSAPEAAWVESTDALEAVEEELVQ